MKCKRSKKWLKQPSDDEVDQHQNEEEELDIGIDSSDKNIEDDSFFTNRKPELYLKISCQLSLNRPFQLYRA